MQVAAGDQQLGADPQPTASHRLAVGVERVPERRVDGVDPQIAAVYGREHLNVGDRVDAVVPGQTFADQRDDLVQRRLRVGAFDQEQVASHPLGRSELRHGAAAHGVGALHDHASGGLAEDMGQARGRHQLGDDQLGERLARADRRELIGVADQYQVGVGADGTQQRDQQLQVGHRRLVDDQEVGGERIVLVVGGTLARNPAQRGVHRAGVDAARLSHPDRGAAGGRDQHHAGALRPSHASDGPDRRGLARTRSAGDQ